MYMMDVLGNICPHRFYLYSEKFALQILRFSAFCNKIVIKLTGQPQLTLEQFLHTNLILILLNIYIWRLLRASAMLFHWPQLFASFLFIQFSLYLLSFHGNRYCGAGVFELIGCRVWGCRAILYNRSLPALHYRPFLIIKIIIIILFSLIRI